MAERGAAALPDPVIGRDPDLDGLGCLVADLVADNLASGRRSRLLVGRRWAATVHVVDADSTFVVELGQGQVRIATRATAPVSLRIQIDGDTLVSLPEVPLALGLPDPRRPEGRVVLRKLLDRELRIAGLLVHVGRLRRLLALLNNV